MHLVDHDITRTIRFKDLVPPNWPIRMAAGAFFALEVKGSPRRRRPAS